MKSNLAQTLQSKVDEHLDLWKLKFVPLFYYKEGKQRVWNVPTKVRLKSGIIIFKSGNTIVDIRYAFYSIYTQIVKSVLRDCKKDADGNSIITIDSIAIVLLDEEKIMPAYELYKFQIALYTQKNIGSRVLDVLQKPNVKSSDVLMEMDFKDPFVDHRAKPRVYTFPRSQYIYLSGIYVVLLDRSKVYYVGRATSLYTRMYTHWIDKAGYDPSRPHKELGKFNHLLDKYSTVEVACIDVCMLEKKKVGNKSTYEYRKAVDIAGDMIDLERELTILFKPMHVDPINANPEHYLLGSEETFVFSPPIEDCPF